MKEGPSKDYERENRHQPGGRWYKILSLIWQEAMTHGELMRAMRNPELSNRHDKARLWAALNEMHREKLIVRTDDGVHITTAGREALAEWRRSNSNHC